MTPWNLTDLGNKDTGDAAGDIAFTLMERAMPMFCRHNPDNSDWCMHVLRAVPVSLVCACVSMRALSM